MVRGELNVYGQGHLLQHLDALEEQQKDELLMDISEVNFKKLTESFSKAKSSLSSSGAFEDNRLKPPDSSIVGSTAKNKEDVQKWMNIGS